MKKRLLLMVLLLGVWTASQAQCPMCKNNVEQARKNNEQTVGNGLNTGILFLMATPYLLIGTLGVLWYRRYRRNQQTTKLHG